MSLEQSLQHLADFVSSADLGELVAARRQFNLFRVLRIEEAEIRHSNVLAWLLDPKESHRQGDLFLRTIIDRIQVDNDYDMLKLQEMDTLDIQVRREWENIDLLAIDRKHKWVLLVENKVRSGATELQLSRYRAIVEKNLPKHRLLPVLLTLTEDTDADIAEAAGYLHWTHTQLVETVSDLLQTDKVDLDPQIRFFIEHYVAAVQQLVAGDAAMVDLCRRVYTQHHEVLDLIGRLGQVTLFAETVEGYLAELPDQILLASGKDEVYFAPASWQERIPALFTRPGDNRFTCRFRLKTSGKQPRIGFVMEVGHGEGFDRSRLIEALQRAGVVDRDRITSQWTRVCSQYVPISNLDDPNELRERLSTLWTSNQGRVEAATTVVQKLLFLSTENRAS